MVDESSKEGTSKQSDCSSIDDSLREFKVFGVFEPAVHYFAGLVSGAAGVLTGHPFDTIKVRLQTQTQTTEAKGKYKSTTHCFTSIVHHEGVRGLFKGMASPLASLTVINSVVFGVYGNIMKQFADQNCLITHFVAGCAAGLAQTVIITPTELIKTRMQVQIDGRKRLYRSPVDCVRKLVRANGVAYLFRGMYASLLRDIPGYGVWFAAYDSTAKALSCDGTLQSASILELGISGAWAGVASWMCNYPVDVIKTKFQADDKFTSYSQACRFTWKTEGFKGFFTGLNSTMIRAVPSNAAIFLAVECTYRLLTDLQEVILARREERARKAEIRNGATKSKRN